MKSMAIRCKWASGNPDYFNYHDNEWGVPVHDDRKHFEFMLLDAFQAGLSWLTILRKRENFRQAFDNFDFEKIAVYDDAKIAELLQNAGIVRNKLKINASIKNAKAFLKIREAFGSFDEYIWGFTDGKVIQNHFTEFGEIPAKTELSDAISKDLKKRGLTFVGSTIIYAYMQAMGMVNDHTTDCYRHGVLH
ncbi:MAG: DNA-3-methyladenine glycosylase I [Bacteroidetes bacterium 4572_114]|nr:MAG: DNA-3-methyladenine glycosylase I [Bacteroidetes bacterium 4572_114]